KAIPKLCYLWAVNSPALSNEGSWSSIPGSSFGGGKASQRLPDMWNNLKWRRVWPLVLGLVLSLGQPVLALDYALDSIKTPDDWFNLDPEENGVMGTSVNKAYELLLKDKSPKQ